MARRDVDYERDADVDRDVVVERDAPARRPVATEPPVVERDVVVERTGALRALRWGPIVAGLLTAIAAFVLMSLLALAVGLQVVDAGEGAAGGDLAARLVGAAIALLAFFLGGFVAAWSAGVTDPGRGFLNGFLVWALWLVAIMVAGALGIGSLFGEAGAMLNNIRAPELTQQEVFDILQTGALGSFLALALTAAAAALGGVVGTRDEVRTRFGEY